MQGVLLGTHPAPFVTQPVKNAAHKTSVFRVDAAWEHNFKIQGVVPTVTVDSCQQV